MILNDNFKADLMTLEEPILILGNRRPDGDSVASMVAMYRELGRLDLTAAVHFVEKPDGGLSWMVEDYMVADAAFLSGFQSIVVVDDSIDSSRLGFEIPSYSRVVCVDHHEGNRPRSSGTLVESFITRYETDKGVVYLGESPSAASVLFSLGVLESCLFVGLYTDTLGFRVNVKSALLLAAEMISSMDITEGQIAGYLKKLGTLNSIESLCELLDCDYSLYDCIDREGRAVQVVCCLHTGDADYKVALSVLRNFGHIICVADRKTGYASLRSVDDYPILWLAQEFGGGGHYCAAGFSLDKAMINTSWRRATERLLSPFSIVRITGRVGPSETGYVRSRL